MYMPNKKGLRNYISPGLIFGSLRYTAKFALSDLNTKVKDLEHEKASLTTTVKIL